MKKAREAAYLALLASLRQEGFISDALDVWHKEAHPSSIDFHFAKEIAFGAARMALSLDFIAEQLSSKKKLKLKTKELALLRIALYQYCFLDRVPSYAIANETVSIAKRYCHSMFVGYLNATLRHISEKIPSLPTGDGVEALSIRYSYPLFFVKELIRAYGVEKAKEVMEAENLASPTMVRLRPSVCNETSIAEGLVPFTSTLCAMALLRDPSQLAAIALSRDYYIQNATPAALIAYLSRNLNFSPIRVLDLCASPGGKLIATYDFFPSAEFYANDLSEQKVARLSENLKKYGITATFSCMPGEEFISTCRFDLIILDVPCSNSGVLHKRPEARWRFSKEQVSLLEEQQLRLINHAKSLLTPQGELWYMTCSILPQENEDLMKKACSLFDLQIKQEQLILPTREGWDGGYACALGVVK